MGCITSKKQAETEPEVKKTYSWNDKEKIDPKEYTISDQTNKTFIKKPGSLKGLPFILQNLENCSIYLFDHLASLSVDNCHNCKFFLGPTKTSVFVNKCSNSVLMVGCQQFRVRDSNDNKIFLHCITGPIIENSFNIQFACYSFFYPELSDQFRSAGLSVFNNLWYQVHDFNGAEKSNNWSLLPFEETPETYFIDIKTYIDTQINCPSKFLNQSPFYRMELSFESVLSVVPKTRGLITNENLESCLIVFFDDGHKEINSKELIKEIHHKPDCELIHTKEFIMKEIEALNVFGTDSYKSLVKRGPLVCLHFIGKNCLKQCLNVAKDVSTKTSASTVLTYVSSNKEMAKRQIELIFNELNQKKNEF